jgi:hypothetical protein
MKKSTARYCIAGGISLMFISVATGPLFVEWWHGRPLSTEVRADYLRGLARLFDHAGDRRRANRLSWESERIRHKWITHVIPCQSEREVQMLLQPLAEEGIGSGQRQVQKSDGSWELHLVVQDQEVLTQALKRIAEIRAELNP